MKCKSCGTEFTVHTRLPDGVYRCPNPHCPAPYVLDQREPSTFKLVIISIFIIGVIFFFLILKSFVSDYASTATRAETTTTRTAPATFAYYETTTQTDTYSFIN